MTIFLQRDTFLSKTYLLFNIAKNLSYYLESITSKSEEYRSIRTINIFNVFCSHGIDFLKVKIVNDSSKDPFLLA